jgi:hypothetical protein
MTTCLAGALWVRMNATDPIKSVALWRMIDLFQWTGHLNRQFANERGAAD